MRRVIDGVGGREGLFLFDEFFDRLRRGAGGRGSGLVLLQFSQETLNSSGHREILGRQTEGWKDGETGGRADRQMDGQTEGRRDRRKDRQTGGWTDRQEDEGTEGWKGGHRDYPTLYTAVADPVTLSKIGRSAQKRILPINVMS